MIQGLEGKLLLKIKEVALATGFCRSKVYQLTKSGELPSVKSGKSVRVPVGDLLTFIEKLKEAN